MQAILKHMLEVTGQRDHQLLEFSILSAVWQTADARQVRMLSVLQDGTEFLLRVRGWIRQNEIHVLHEIAEYEAELEQVERYPTLANCLRQGGGCARGRAADGCYMLWLPIWVDGKAISCLEITRQSAYSRRFMDVLEGMVGVYRNYQSLLEYSERDSLTGLLNRKTFERHFSRAKADARHASSGAKSSEDRRHSEGGKEDNRFEWLAVVDIDHFKHVNDTFGHLYGDEVLILIANLMTKSFRDHDRIFRFGGEEFVILIHSASLADVNMVVERFRLAVQNHAFPQVGKITISAGYTCFHPKESPVEVLGHADQALYFAKTHGRNRCCQYEQLVASGDLIVPEHGDGEPIEYF